VVGVSLAVGVPVGVGVDNVPAASNAPIEQLVAVPPGRTKPR
jgi:hypothetical protein